jgi:hypothetical protein
MFVRLTRAKRLMAGRVIALVYAFCVLAPTLSFALPGSQAESPCLTDTNHVPGMMHFHADAPATHLHADGIMHDHGMQAQAIAHPHTSPSHDSPSHDLAPIKASALPDQAPPKGTHSSSAQCCGLMCLTALPAALLEIVTPSVPTLSQEIDGYLEVADNGPSRLYRPPIA